MDQKKRIAFVLAAVLSAAFPIVARSQSNGSNPAPTFQERYPRYRLHAGDILDLTFTFTPEFNQTVTVQPDGYINLRGVGDGMLPPWLVPFI